MQAGLRGRRTLWGAVCNPRMAAAQGLCVSQLTMGSILNMQLL